MISLRVLSWVIPGRSAEHISRESRILRTPIGSSLQHSTDECRITSDQHNRRHARRISLRARDENRITFLKVAHLNRRQVFDHLLEATTRARSPFLSGGSLPSLSLRVRPLCAAGKRWKPGDPAASWSRRSAGLKRSRVFGTDAAKR